jgi:hypothetical protein
MLAHILVEVFTPIARYALQINPGRALTGAPPTTQCRLGNVQEGRRFFRCPQRGSRCRSIRGNAGGRTRRGGRPSTSVDCHFRIPIPSRCGSTQPLANDSTPHRQTRHFEGTCVTNADRVRQRQGPSAAIVHGTNACNLGGSNVVGLPQRLFPSCSHRATKAHRSTRGLIVIGRSPLRSPRPQKLLCCRGAQSTPTRVNRFKLSLLHQALDARRKPCPHIFATNGESRSGPHDRSRMLTE